MIFEDSNSLQLGYAQTDEEQQSRIIRRSFAKAKEDYLTNSNSPNDFYDWMEITYGIKFILEYDSRYSSLVPLEWKVVDEAKFLAYYLKYQ
ncbi:MAG TPA: hypothetical protein VFM18_17160 [Methanosarcina sp.]|nr:hypothetical protein [Methanosarcina sp.]